MRRLVAALLAAGLSAQNPSQVVTVPVRSGGFSGGRDLDAVLNAAVKADQIPGAVLLVGHNGQIVYQKAYGSRSLAPRREPMTLDTIFDVASLTKVVATTSSIMKLIEQGKVRLNDRVSVYLPEFQAGKSEITVKQLLTHYSGMRPDLDLEPAWSGYETGIRKALMDHPAAPPNSRFTYSDINFLLLGEIVRQVSGKTLPRFAEDEIFLPLGMRDTMFTPPATLRNRIAPTEIVRDYPDPLRGMVHDPTARYMGGVAGHAGLFSTAGDLAKFAQMMLENGERGPQRIFSPMTVHAFTTPQSPPEGADVRGLGWDIDSRFSGNRGDLFPVGSYGHTGFTGTSMWIDPFSGGFVILLTNSVHPKARASITPLRSRVASAAAAGLNPAYALALPPRISGSRRVVPARPAPRTSPVLTGIDVLAADNFSVLRGKRVGLVTNHTGLTRDGKRNVDVMVAGGVDLRALYSPEHGIAGKEDQENVTNVRDQPTGIPVWSLYAGQTRRPSSEMLKDIDTLVFDIQDVGARFYTYMCTMKNVMEEVAQRNLEFIVLDRPNPITGEHVEGPVLETDLMSFIGCAEIPLRHGMTAGELAGFMNAGLQPKARLNVIRMQGWHRADWFDSTGLVWVDPSPNMRSLNAALLYPGIGMFEASKNYSVGRGTDAPFEQVGAEWIDGQKLAEYLNGRSIPGIRVYATRFRPAASNLSGKTAQGIRFVITDREKFESVRFGIELGAGLERLFPGQMTWPVNSKLTGSQDVLADISKSVDPAVIQRRFEAATEAFRVKRSEYLLY